MSKAGWIAAGVLGLYLIVARGVDDAKAREIAAAKDQAFVGMARRAGLAQSVAVTRAEIMKNLDAQLAAKVAAVQKDIPDAQVTRREETTVKIADTAKGVETVSTASPGKLLSVEDEYGRFHFDLTGAVPLLTRKQKFVVRSIALKRLNGKSEMAAVSVREYSPVTGAEIPTTGIEATSLVELHEEIAPAVGFFHLRLVAAADHRLALGAGVQVLNVKDRANLSLLGLYSPKDKEARAALAAGWRLRFPFLDTNASVGPYAGVSSKGGWVFGAAATLEITR